MQIFTVLVCYAYEPLPTTQCITPVIWFWKPYMPKPFRRLHTHTHTLPRTLVNMSTP